MRRQEHVVIRPNLRALTSETTGRASIQLCAVVSKTTIRNQPGQYFIPITHPEFGVNGMHVIFHGTGFDVLFAANLLKAKALCQPLRDLPLSCR